MVTLSFTKEGDNYVALYNGAGGGLEVNCPSGTTVYVYGDISGNGNYSLLYKEKCALFTGILDMNGLTRVKIVCDCATAPTGYVNEN